MGRPVIIHHTIAIGHTQAHACACVMYMYVQVYRAEVLHILDWWLDVCTGLVYYMYWTGCVELDWVDWCDVYTGLGTGVCTVVCTQLEYCMRGGKGVKHCPCTIIKEGGWWEVLHPHNVW